MNQESRLTLLGHLEELRKRLMWVVIVVGIGAGVSFYFAEDIIDILKSVADDDIRLQAIEPTEVIGTYFKLCINCGIALGAPVILYQIVMFIRPALSIKERRYLYVLLPGMLISFVVGVVFAYFVLLPPAMTFLFKFGSGVADIEWRVSNYVNMIVRLLFAIGLCFETPIIMYFLTKIGILTPQRLTRFRRFAIVCAFIIAAIITPTFDPINQTIVAVPLIILYEIGILLSRIAHRGNHKEEAKVESEDGPFVK
ncbi:MAG: twin-arginine translocase subunit TatC [Chloroflexi bacterium]|jgi:sec-independent protein translocase protein TatC|nr:twin-arginine translocase subunit TatC [Chloroflexota bacterium]